MKRIEEYINSIYQGFDAEEQEVKELKDEMRTHLLQAVKELKEEGYTEEQAQDIAIDRFGDPKSLVKQLGELYRIRRIQRIFSKVLLKFALSLGILGILGMTSFFAWNNVFSHHFVRSLNNEILQAAEVHADKIKHNNVPEELKQKIIEVENGHISIQAVGIEITSAADQTSGPYSFAYPASSLNNEGYMRSDHRPFIYTMYYVAGGAIKNTDIQVHLQFMQWRFSEEYFMIGVNLFFGYWVLFTAWGIMNVYYNRDRYKLGWVLLIACFNVFGYWLYLKIRPTNI
ncbi:permease prefix domain 1-containing protein [Paenibacillus tarimensis]